MHRVLSMTTSIDYLHIPLKSRLAITQNEVKANPCLVTTQISIWNAILASFEPHFGGKIPSKNDLWQPLKRHNVNDIIMYKTNYVILCITLSTLKGRPVIRSGFAPGTGFPSDSLSESS